MYLKAILHAGIRERFERLAPWLNERTLRAWAGAEATAWGRGGVRAVAAASGLAIHTVRRGVAELTTAPAAEEKKSIRRPGGGRKALADQQPQLLATLEQLVTPSTRGDPRRPLLWTCKSVRRLAAQLVEAGFTIRPAKTAELLHELGYTLPSQRKREEGASHPDRDAQFEHINRKVVALPQAGQPVISVDTKKKELVGLYRNGGREWRPKGQPEAVKVHDFILKTAVGSGPVTQKLEPQRRCGRRGVLARNTVRRPQRL